MDPRSVGREGRAAPQALVQAGPLATDFDGFMHKLFSGILD